MNALTFPRPRPHVCIPRGWMLTIGETVIPFAFQTKKAAVAYAERKVNGQDPE